MSGQSERESRWKIVGLRLMTDCGNLCLQGHLSGSTKSSDGGKRWRKLRPTSKDAFEEPRLPPSRPSAHLAQRIARLNVCVDLCTRLHPVQG
eukprot:2262699-Pleurochrysis_carterae.AAC.3